MSILDQFISDAGVDSSDPEYGIYDSAVGRSIPLVYKDVKDIRQVSSTEERELALWGCNSIPDVYPAFATSNTLIFRTLSASLPAGSSIVSITHTYVNTNGGAKWFAVVVSSNSIYQIWRSSDKVQWTLCTLDKSDYNTSPFVINTIRADSLHKSDNTRPSWPSPRIAAFGNSGVCIISTNLEDFKVVPMETVNSNLTDWFRESLVDAAYNESDQSWVVIGDSGSRLLYTSSRDLVTDNWSDLTVPFIGMKSIAYDGDTNRLVIVGMGNISTSTNDGSTWTTTSNASWDVKKVRYVNGIWFAVGKSSNGNGLVLRSTDGATWTSMTITQSSGAILEDMDYGDSRWVISASYPAGRFWYSNNAAGTTFYHEDLAAPNDTNFAGYDLEYGGGDGTEWLMTSSVSDKILIADNIPEYHGSLLATPLGDATYKVGDLKSEHLDSSGSLVSEDYNIYQFVDSDIDYSYYFSDNNPIFIGADSEGNLRELVDSSAEYLGTRLASYMQTFDFPGAFKLARDDSAPDSAEWEVWMQDAFINTMSVDSSYSYSIYRRMGDSAAENYEHVLELDAFNDTEYVMLVYVDTGYYINRYFNGIKPSVEASAPVTLKLINLATSQTDIGDYTILPEPQTPNGNGLSGTWKERGEAVNSYYDAGGNTVTVDTYNLWVKSAL